MTETSVTARAQARAADPACTAQSDAAVFERLARTRYSCRAFAPKPVARDTIRAILGQARHAASWCNVQPWVVHLVSGAPLEALRRKLMAATAGATDIAAPPAYEGIHRARRQASGWQLYDALSITREDYAGRMAQAARNACLFDAPHLAVLSVPASIGPYALLDCGGFLAHFQLAARAHGVDSIAQAALAHHAGLLHEALAIPPQDHVVCGISFGYAIADHPVNGYRTDRARVDEFTTWLGDQP